MKNFSFIYEITRPIVMPAIRVFYKQIQIKNFEKLPDKGAVFICSNHVNAFMDPVSIQLHTSRQVFSLARGDAFKKPFMNWLLTQWKLIPIYRLSEGTENLKKNEYTFSTSEQVLSNGNALVIYPEAICVQERRIRKLKKGAARIAFGVEEKNGFNADLVILPLGLNYSNPKKFRSKLFMNFGEPIITSTYNELYKQDKVKAINELTAVIERAMKKLVVNIQHKENDQLVEDLYVVYKPQLIGDLQLDPKDLEGDFKASCDIANAVNYFQTTEPQLIETVKQKLNNYTQQLTELHLRDQLLTQDGLSNLSGIRVLADSIVLVLGMPFFLIGLLLNYPPYKLGDIAANKLAKEVEFHASINMTVAWFSWIAYYLMQLVVIGLLFHNWLLLGIYALLAPITGVYALRFCELKKKIDGRRRLFGIKRSNKTQFENLVAHRAGLMKLLNDVKQKYCGYFNSSK